jgi:hypothetical protein
MTCRLRCAAQQPGSQTALLLFLDVTSLPLNLAAPRKGRQFFAAVSYNRGFPGLVIRDAWSAESHQRPSINARVTERVGASVRVRTLPTGVENPDQQAERATGTASANRGSDRPADVLDLRQEADAR